MSGRTCPDCERGMQRVDHSSTGALGTTAGIRIRDPRKSATLGVGGKTYLQAYLCTGCALVRFYAET